MKKMVWGLSVILVSAVVAQASPFSADGVVTVRFINNSGYPNEQVHVYVTGSGNSGNGYYNWSTQSYTVPRISPVTQMTTTLQEIESEGEISVSLPAIDIGRIYFSYGVDFDALSFDCVNGQPGYGPSDRLLYDKVEFNSYNPAYLNMNTTNVDFWSLPFTFEAIDKNTGSLVTYGFQTDITGIRNVIFGAFGGVPDMGTQECSNSVIFRENLIQRETDGTIWRLIAPDKVAVPSPDHPDPLSGDWHGNFQYFSYFWNDYVKDQCWVPGRTITLPYNNQTYVGAVDGAGELLSWTLEGGSFEEYSRPAWASKPAQWPTGTEIDQNFGHVIFGGAAEFTSGLLAPVINSAIQRGTMHLNGSEWFREANFYQGTDSPHSPVNHYGRILHHYSIDRQCYALSYDDGGGYNTSIYVDEGGTFTITLLPFGGAGRPRWIHDYNGDGTSDIGIFRESTGLWSVRNFTRVYFGSSADYLVPADYNGDGTTDVAIFRESSGMWSVRSLSRFYLGTAGDVPVPGDYVGNGTSEAGLFRGSSGLWAIRNVTRVYFGSTGDSTVPGYYDLDDAKDIAIFRGSTGMWSVRNLTRFCFGSADDDLVPGDYTGSGKWEGGIFRPSAGMWSIRNLTRFYLGNSTDQPVPGDYNGNGVDDAGIFRDSSGLWAVCNLTRVYFGTAGDLPVTR